MNTSPDLPVARRLGFTLVEVIIAVGVVGVAIASLIGILASTFQQVNDIMQTNAALTSAQGLVTALDNPRIIFKDLTASSGVSKNETAASYLDNTADKPNFDIVYDLLKNADTPANGVWVYVYERKQVISSVEVISSATNTYNLNGNPALVEVVKMTSDNFTPDLAQARNVLGSPMRVRLTLSKLLVGQRVRLDPGTGEPFIPATVYAGGSLPLVDEFALAYLPIVAEFYPHEYESATVFKANTEQQPVLVQTIVINR